MFSIPDMRVCSSGAEEGTGLMGEFSETLLAYADRQGLPRTFADAASSLYAPIASAAVTKAKAVSGLFVLGLCGPQGSGKSTAAAVLAMMIEDAGLNSAVLSLDDLYLTRAVRERLAAEVHPLFATRGVPGTHDVALGLSVLERLAAGSEPVALPRFDKARDDRQDEAAWPVIPAGLKVLVFEGWCLGARPEPDAALALPVNDLERGEDPDGRWRHHVNAALAGPYRPLFARLEMLVMLRAPDFSAVAVWREEQEAKLRASIEAGTNSRVMDAVGVARFVQHYERTTRQMDREMPDRADVVISLDEQRGVAGVKWHV